MRSPQLSALRIALALALFALPTVLGDAAAETIRVAQPPGETGLALRAQDRAGVAIHFGLNTFDLNPVEVEGSVAQAVSMPGVFLPNDAGAPDLPGLGRYVAIPHGATARVTILNARTERIEGVEIAPAPVIPLENDDGPLVYEKDLSIYERDTFYPAKPVRVSDPMTMRGVDVVIVGVTPFQYNPITKELLIYTELELRVDFVGGNGLFGETRLRSRFWEPILRAQLLNYETLPAVELDGPRDGSRYGYEYVIITPTDPGFVAWGDSLKLWRNLQGISTEVFTTAETGTSASSIESWLNNAYTTWAQPPAAFLILGDYPSSGDGGRDIAITAPVWSGYCVSDNIYADVDGDDLPDMAHGRICARDATELGHMITKMLDYERQPYTDAGFYDHPVIAGGWQTERWFILCTEVCYGHQANVLGKHPVREYAIYSGTPGSVWSTATNTSTVVNYFGPNGLGYIPSTPEHLTDWGSNATRVNNDLNAGAYMMLHRDHGYEYGWGEPDYDKYDLDGLSNPMYPFIFSINCLTGRYDYGAETFTEKFHRMNYGAIGLVAASEVSYSFVNDTFVWGMFDGLWEGFMPDYGPYPHGPDPLRTCFGMCYGKYFLEASNWPYNTSSKTVTYHLFHHHGDAYLRMYSEVPYALSVTHDTELCIDAGTFGIQANAGALIALTVDGAIIGVAEATGAWQDVPVTPQSETGTLRITVTAPNAYRYDQSVPISTCGSTLTADFAGDPTSGCAPLTVAFTDFSTGGDITSWDWDFGDGGTSTAQNPAHEYLAAGTYTVSLTVSGPAGTDTETKTNYISVSAAPTADFSGSPTSGSEPLTVQFTDLSTGQPTTWSWDFGDGGTSSEQNPSHTYPAGDYTVALTVTNGCGSDVETKTGYIHVEAPPPVALALSDIPVAGTVSGSYLDTHVSDNTREVITEVSSQTHPRKWYSTLEHRWDFNVQAGTSITFHLEAYRPANSDGDDFTFEYSTDGNAFTPLVTVASSTEQSYSAALPDYISGTVYVRVVDTDHSRDHQSLDSIYIDYMDIESISGPVPPIADFEGVPTSGYAPLIVQFTDLSSGAPTAWSWDFGDGGTSAVSDPSYQYDLPGTYTVSLTVTNEHGSDTETKTGYIVVTEMGSGELHVQDMTVERKIAGINASGLCTVLIYDEADQPVSGAVVDLTYTGPNNGSLSGTTGTDGRVTVETSKSRNPVGEWCFEVTNVTLTGYSYNPLANLVTIACESGPVSDPAGLEVVQLSLSGPVGARPARGLHAVSFSLAEPGLVELAIYSVTGRKVATLADGWRAAGAHTVSFDASHLGAGVYFCRLQTADRREVRKVMLIR